MTPMEEPAVLQLVYLTFLINGASRIAVSMAMPPHNLTEVINATSAYNNDIDTEVWLLTFTQVYYLWL